MELLLYKRIIILPIPGIHRVRKQIKRRHIQHYRRTFGKRSTHIKRIEKLYGEYGINGIDKSPDYPLKYHRKKVLGRKARDLYYHTQIVFKHSAKGLTGSFAFCFLFHCTAASFPM